MRKIFTYTLLLLFSVPAIMAKAQTPVPGVQPYGTVSNEDLQMKACDFEKDANAEMLFKKGNLYFGQDCSRSSWKCM